MPLSKRDVLMSLSTILFGRRDGSKEATKRRKVIYLRRMGGRPQWFRIVEDNFTTQPGPNCPRQRLRRISFDFYGMVTSRFPTTVELRGMVAYTIALLLSFICCCQKILAIIHGCCCQTAPLLAVASCCCHTFASRINALASRSLSQESI
jgi:hypothetical protein